MTKIFFAPDIHGSEICFMKFINATRFYKVDAVILGGDLTGKMIVPIVEQPNGSFRSNYLGIKRVVKTQEEIKSLMKNIRFGGGYPFLTNLQEMEELKANDKKVDELFSRLMIETIERWIKIADERLKDTEVKCFMLPGNDDRVEIDESLRKSEYIINPEGKVVEIDGQHEMISTGYANITPWKAPRDITESELSKKIDDMVSQVKNIRNCIFNFHCPPYGTPLDLAPQLDETLKPVTSGNQVIITSVGSTAVCSSIEKYQPLLGLHGHIHECRAFTKIGRTLCINPGSEYAEGILRGCIVSLIDNGDMNENRIMFTSG